MRAVVFTGVGGNEVVRVEERPDPQPGSEELLVAAAFAGVNTADLAQRAGSYPPPPGAPQDVPGLEVAGTVVAAGGAVRGFANGDRVFGLVGGGGLADRVIVHERHVARVPDRLGEQEAAAVPEAFITAHDAIVSQGGLRLGDVLVVTGANGGVGTAAVQIGRQAGARVLATVRREELRARVAELGAEVFAPEELVERARAAGGADVVLELVGGPSVEAGLDGLALKGRIVIVGHGAGSELRLPVGKLMGRRARLFGTVLRARPLEEKAAAVQSFAHDVVPLLAEGRLRAVVDRVFPVDAVTEAFDHMQQPGKLGKVLLEF